MSKINIFWFRRDLRLEDNIGLYNCSESGTAFLPIFIFDTTILEKLKEKNDSRVQFIHNNLSIIKDKLQENGSDLKVYFDTPEKAFKKILNEFDVDSVYCNEDYEPSAIKRDKLISAFLNKKNIELKSFKDHCIFAKNDILKSDGKPYTVYTAYKNKWLSSLVPENISSIKIKKMVDKLFKIKPDKIVSMSELGFEELSVTTNLKPIRKKMIIEFEDKRDFPALDATSGLGVHLRFGTISVRKCVQQAYHSDDKAWLKALIWREFFIQILFHFPHAEKKAFKAKYENIKWVNNRTHFKKWCEGKTGYPLVDAGMRELNETGFMHNRVRMVCASFLIKHLLIDWRWGEHYFAQKLLDFDLSANNGNWQWVAGTGCDSAPYFRIFNPEIQLKKFDTKLIYVKKWVAEYGTEDYPEPIVDHRTAYNKALITYKQGIN